MRGYLLLSQGRSGSTWLESLANSTGIMGNCDEWLDHALLAGGKPEMTGDEFFEKAIQLGTTDNGRFAVKIFPRHLYWVQSNYGYDFVEKCMATYDTGLISLRREDSLAQAISFAKAVQTNQWTSIPMLSSEPNYDFELVVKCHAFITQGRAFWDSYLGMSGRDITKFTYEGLVDDPTPFIEVVAGILAVDCPENVQSDLKIQRDKVSDEWRARFQEDAKSRNLVKSLAQHKIPARTLRNLGYFLRKESIPPFSLDYGISSFTKFFQP